MKAAGSSRSKAMGQESIGRLLLRFSGPVIVYMAVTASFYIVEAMFVGRLGPEALAALTVGFPLVSIFISIGMGTGVGVASLISRHLGAEDQDGASRVAGLGAIQKAVHYPGIAPGRHRRQPGRHHLAQRQDV